MLHQEEQLIRKWCKLRTPDKSKRFLKITLKYFDNLDQENKKKMIKEFQDYCLAVNRGIIKPTALEL